MSSTWRERLQHALAYRLAVWYAVLFLVSVGALAGLTYLLLDASLQQRDHEIIQSTTQRYATAYERGGLGAVEAAIQSEQATGRYEPLLVRVLGRRRDVVFLSMPERLDRLRSRRRSRPRAPRRAVVGHRARPGWRHPRDRLGAARRRHALPGRQEHGEPARAARAVPPRAPARSALRGAHRRGRRRTPHLLRPAADSRSDTRRTGNVADRTTARARAGPPHQRCPRRAQRALQRDAQPDRETRRRYARSARQRVTRSAHADGAASRDGGSGAAIAAGCRDVPRGARPTASRNRIASSRC